MPPTGTILPIDAATDPLRRELALALDREHPEAGERWLAGFSGGPDSTALAAALAPLAAARGLELHLLHVDHGLDAGSPARATRAAALAVELGLPCRVVRAPVERRRRESPEAAARRVRYAALERARAELGATRILTAHQRDDQVETVLLRLLLGSGLLGLAGIPASRGHCLRPLLRVSRAEIERFLAGRELKPVEDPTNRDPRVPRNRLRHRLLPRLRAEDAGLDEVVLALSARAAALRARLEHRLEQQLGKASIERGLPAEALLDLPGALRVHALVWLLERSGFERPPSVPSMAAFLRGLESVRRGVLAIPRDERRLVARGGRLALVAPESSAGAFAYTLEFPGEVELPELGLRLRVRRSAVEPWMFVGDRCRGAFALSGQAAVGTVRSRRPGDRIRPLGGPGERKLKDLLIDRGVPADERDRLPLLEVGGRIAWVPGVAIDHAFRVQGTAECWVAELEPLGQGGNGPRRAEVERGERMPS